MQDSKLTYFAVALIALILSAGNSLAEDTAQIQLSYKILESQNDGGTLTMTVKLKAKNTTVDPIYNLSAINIYADKITIGVAQVDIGNIEAGKTATSAESFIITVNFPGGEQEKPLSETVWQVEYEKPDGHIVTEEILLQ